ncbi:MAG: insulinase family protein [Treponema sp.]|nr:insulinase family protein [Treponema sp.]
MKKMMKRFCCGNIKVFVSMVAFFVGVNLSVIFCGSNSHGFGGNCLYAFGEREVTESKLSNGIPVYIVKNENNKIDSVCIGVKGGTAYYSEDLSGIENATFKMMLTGSANYSKNDMQNIVYATNSRYKAGSLREGSVLSLVSMDEYLKETLPLLLDGFVHPKFDAKEYENLMNDYKAGIQNMMNEPLSMAFYYGKQILYNNHPYATSAGVSPSSVSNITLRAIKNYHSELMNSNRIFVVAITNMPQNELVPLLEEYLGSIPVGEELKTATEPKKITKKEKENEHPSFDLNQEPLVLSHPSAEGTGFVIRAYNAAGFKSKDYIPLLIAENIYRSILYHVIRAKYGMCYSAECTNFGDVENVGFEYLYRISDFTDLKSRMSEARNIINRGEYIIGTNDDGKFIYGRISDDFENFVNSVKNSMYSGLATTASTANTLCTSLLLWGDLDSLDEHRNRINSVSISEVQTAFVRYINSDSFFWIGVVGPENEELLEEILNEK